MFWGFFCWLVCFSHISLFTCHKIYMYLTHKYIRQRHFSLTHREADIYLAKFRKTHRIDMARHKEYDSFKERILKSGRQFSILFHQELNCFQVWEWKGFQAFRKQRDSSRRNQKYMNFHTPCPAIDPSGWLWCFTKRLECQLERGMPSANCSANLKNSTAILRKSWPGY